VIGVQEEEVGVGQEEELTDNGVCEDHVWFEDGGWLLPFVMSD
jgi:hypothetical protein